MNENVFFILSRNKPKFLFFIVELKLTHSKIFAFKPHVRLELLRNKWLTGIFTESVERTWLCLHWRLGRILRKAIGSKRGLFFSWFIFKAQGILFWKSGFKVYRGAKGMILDNTLAIDGRK